MAEGEGERDVFSYEPFARHAFYTDVNRRLVRRVLERAQMPAAGEKLFVVDLGAGTGALSRILVETLHECGLGARITAVEPSAAALAVAERELAGSATDIRFVHGDAAELAWLAPIDAVFFCNAIHLVPDKDELASTVVRALVPGGLFALNSAFFTGAYPPGTEAFYRLWTARALRRLRRQHPEIRLRRGQRAQAMDWMPPEGYEAMLRRHGFDVAQRELDEVQMTLRSFQDIGHYWLFIEGALPGAPLAAGAEALGYGAAEAFTELSVRSVPRRWLQLIARAGAVASFG